MSDVEVEHLLSNETNSDENNKNNSNNPSLSTLENQQEIDQTDSSEGALDSHQHQIDVEIPSTEEKTPTNSRIEKDENEDNEDTEEEIEVLEDIIHHNIFLRSSTDSSFAPYTAHCLLLSNATVLVLLSQVFSLFLFGFQYK